MKKFAGVVAAIVIFVAGSMASAMSLTEQVNALEQASGLSADGETLGARIHYLEEQLGVVSETDTSFPERIATLEKLLGISGTGLSSETKQKGVSILLHELEPFSCNLIATYIDSRYWTDNYGNTYKRTLSDEGSNSDRDQIEYLLDGKYTTLSGTLYVPRSALEDMGNFESDIPRFSVYGDDVMLFSHTGCAYKDEPIKIAVDIQGVRFLKIVFDGAFYSAIGWGNRPILVLGDPVLWK